MELCTELFSAVIPTLFLCFCWSAVPTSYYILMLFCSCYYIWCNSSVPYTLEICAPLS